MSPVLTGRTVNPDQPTRLGAVQPLFHQAKVEREADYGLAVGVEKLAGAGLLGAGGKKKEDADTWPPSGRYGAVAPIDGRIGTETMPGVFAQIGIEYGHKYGGTSFELFAKSVRRTTPTRP